MTEQRDFEWASWGQLVASILGAFILLGISLGGMLLMYMTGVEGVVPISSAQKTSFFLLLAGVGFIGVMLIPSAVYAARRLSGFSEADEVAWQGAGWIIILYPILLGVGHIANVNDVGGRFLMGTAHILANGVAVFWVLNLGRKGIADEPPQRFWGVFGSGLALAPFLSILFEFLLLVLVGGIWYAYLLQHLGLKDQITNLVERLPQSAASPAILERMVSKYVFTPGVLISVFSYVAVMIPLVEEILKPIGVWLLIQRKLTPEEGLTLGMLSGAGYALFENLTLSANTGVWSMVMVSRFGTTAVHMLTSGLVGWGLASAWSEGKHMRLAKAFISSVVFHGVWNGLNLLSAFVQFSGARDTFGDFIYWGARYASVGLVLLAMGSFYGLIRTNRLVRRDIMTRVGDA